MSLYSPFPSMEKWMLSFSRHNISGASQCRSVLLNNLKSRVLQFLSMHATLDKLDKDSQYLNTSLK